MELSNNFNWKLKWILCTVILIWSNSLFAIGLGELKVNSYLNQPLNADIILTGVEELEGSAIIAELASAKDFLRAGIPRPLLLSSLKFEIQKTKDNFKIHISTTKVIKDPFIDFLIQVTWPDGTIVKSYTILLDPVTEFSNSNHADNSNDLVPSRSDPIVISSQNNNQFKPDFNNDGIFSTSLEESSDNEILFKPNELDLEKDLNVPKKNSKIIKKDPVVVNSNPNVFSATTSSSNETNNSSENDFAFKDYENNSNGVLSKIVNTLQSFSENQQKNKSNYEKLLDLQPNIIALNKEEQKLAESASIAQINSELNILRNMNDPSKQQLNISNPVNDSTPKNVETNHTHQEINSQNFNNNVNPNNNYNLYYSDGGAIANRFKLNDLLWAFFLATTTMFIFYKMISSSTYAEELVSSNFGSSGGIEPQDRRSSKVLVEDQQVVNNLNNMYTNTEQPEIKYNHNVNLVANNSVIVDQAIPQDYSVEINVNEGISSQPQLPQENFPFVRNEELELKMALANQYIEAGDRQSARELLEEIINVKEQRYHNKITAMLRSIS